MVEAFQGSLEFRWGPDENEPTLVANNIDLLREGLEDATLPMLAAREIVVGDMEDRFNREVDLDGNPWKPRSAATLKAYERSGASFSTILRKDDHLFNAVTDVDSYQVDGNDMFIDTSSWPVYWHIHDQGGMFKTGVTIPARPFVGISESAQFEIIDVFDQWVNREIRLSMMRGTLMMRAPSGRLTGRVTRANLIPRSRATHSFDQ